MAHSFKPGDIVKLLSGGPKMTVKKILPRDFPVGDGELVACQWFAGSTLKAGNFEPTSIQKVIEPNGK